MDPFKGIDTPINNDKAMNISKNLTPKEGYILCVYNLKRTPLFLLV